jgi:hypothetical protein
MLEGQTGRDHVRRFAGLGRVLFTVGIAATDRVCDFAKLPAVELRWFPTAFAKVADDFV